MKQPLVSHINVLAHVCAMYLYCIIRNYVIYILCFSFAIRITKVFSCTHQTMHQPSSLSSCVHGVVASSTTAVSDGNLHPSALHKHVSSVDTMSPHGTRAGILTDAPVCRHVASPSCSPVTGSEQVCINLPPDVTTNNNMILLMSTRESVTV